jgi:hypothetical protein
MQQVVKFDYGKEQLEEIVLEIKRIDRSNIEAVKDGHRKLVKVRTTITGQGKDLRDDAIKFQKSVIEKEKEYLAITVPLEEELKSVLDDEKEKIVMEARKQLLPQKREQLALLEYTKEITDEELLMMSDEIWVHYYQNAMEINRLEKKRIEDEKQAEIEREENEKIKAENDRLKAEAEEAERIRKEKEKEAEEEKEKAQKEIFEKNMELRINKLASLGLVFEDGIYSIYNIKIPFGDIQTFSDDAFNDLLNEVKLVIDEEERQNEIKLIEEQKKLEADNKYQEFLKENNYSEETDRVVEKDGVVRIYRLVAEFKR